MSVKQIKKRLEAATAKLKVQQAKVATLKGEAKDLREQLASAKKAEADKKAAK